jgi:dCMP deaminase
MKNCKHSRVKADDLGVYCDLCGDRVSCNHEGTTRIWDNIAKKYCCSICTRPIGEFDTDPSPPPSDRQRPSWPETWMSIARVIAARSVDQNLKVGAIIVSEDNTRMLSVGYNGDFAGGPDVRDSSEPGKSGFLHAELNCIIKCDYNFSKKKIMYVTHSPCRDCCKIIVNAGISKVIYETAYRDMSGLEILKRSSIDVNVLSDLLLS